MEVKDENESDNIEKNRRRKWTRRREFQILDETDSISHSTNTLGKGMNPIILPPAMGK